MIEGRCQARVSVAASGDLSVRPYLETNFLERTAIFRRGTTGKKNSRAIDLLWQLSENCAQTLGRGKAEIRRRQFSVLDNAKFRTERTNPSYGFYEHPGGFRAAAFNAEDALAGFHDCYCRAGAPPAASLFIILARKTSDPLALQTLSNPVILSAAKDLTHSPLHYAS